MRQRRSGLRFNRFRSNKQTRANDEARMTNDETMTKPRLCSRHPERSRRIPWNYFEAFATGLKAWPRGLRPLRWSLARNDRNWNRHSCFVICFALTAPSLFAEPPPSAKEILDSVRMIES